MYVHNSFKIHNYKHIFPQVSTICRTASENSCNWVCNVLEFVEGAKYPPPRWKNSVVSSKKKFSPNSPTSFWISSLLCRVQTSTVKAFIVYRPSSYRVNHKGCDFRDDMYIIYDVYFLILWILCNYKTIFKTKDII